MLFGAWTLTCHVRNSDCFSHNRVSTCGIWDGMALEGISCSNTSKDIILVLVPPGSGHRMTDIAGAAYSISMLVHPSTEMDRTPTDFSETEPLQGAAAFGNHSEWTDGSVPTVNEFSREFYSLLLVAIILQSVLDSSEFVVKSLLATEIETFTWLSLRSSMLHLLH